MGWWWLLPGPEPFDDLNIAIAKLDVNTKREKKALAANLIIAYMTAMNTKTWEHPLRTWRIDRRLTLAELGRIIGVTPSHLSEIERGQKTPSLEMAARLSAATKGDIKIEDFLIQP